MNRPPASYLNSSVMGNYLLNWNGLISNTNYKLTWIEVSGFKWFCVNIQCRYL